MKKYAKHRISILIRQPASALLVLSAALLLGCGRGQHQEAANSIPALPDGFPRTLDELQTSYVEPPAGQNAATFYSQGFAALQLGSAASSSLPILGRGHLPLSPAPLTAGVRSGLAAVLQANQRALGFFAQGAKCEQCRYPVDLSLGFKTLLPHLLNFRNAMLVTEVSAVLRAEANDGKQAATDVLTALAMVRSLEAEPSLTSQMMRVASLPIAVNALEQTLNRSVLAPESLDSLFSVLQKMEESEARGEGFNRGFAAEHATAISMLAAPPELLEALKLPDAVSSEAERQNILKRLQKTSPLSEETAFLEDAYSRLMVVRQEALPGRLKAAATIQERAAEASRRKLSVIAMLWPGLAPTAAKEARCLASLRLGLTALALERFRSANHDRYPTALADLTPGLLPSLLADPFDGEPLRYLRQGNGYVLYSIGPDLQDDLGERLDGANGDITFSIAYKK